MASVGGRAAIDEGISQRRCGTDDFNAAAMQDEIDPGKPGATHGGLRTEDDAAKSRRRRGDQLGRSPRMGDARARPAGSRRAMIAWGMLVKSPLGPMLLAVTDTPFV